MAQTFTPRLNHAVCPLLPGLFYGSPATPYNTITPANGTLSGARITVGRSATITTLGINVTVAGSAGAVIRLGLMKFVWTPSGWTTTLLADAGTVDATTTGVKTVTVSVPVTAGDIILPVAVTQGAPTTLPTYGGVAGIDGAIGASTASTMLTAVIVGVQILGVTGALPATPTMIVSGAAPRIAVSAAA